ncbi:MAG: NUDIX domain-containing protein [Gammaproteobacteria bacterium]|nr:NUDIX domain-containing protein [Gammaproteobacteria bacterium]
MSPTDHATPSPPWRLRGSQQPKDITLIAKDEVYRGFFSLKRYQLQHRLFQGGVSRPLMRECLDRGNAVALLLYDPHQDAVVLIEQFRVGALAAAGGAWLIEIIAGVLDEERDCEAVARRESMEEAGCVVGRIAFICDYLVSPGGTSESISLYCGEVDSRQAGGFFGLDAEGEDIHAFVVPFQRAWEWLEAGEINSASPIIALQWLQINRQRLRQLWSA